MKARLAAGVAAICTFVLSSCSWVIVSTQVVNVGDAHYSTVEVERVGDNGTGHLITPGVLCASGAKYGPTLDANSPEPAFEIPGTQRARVYTNCRTPWDWANAPIWRPGYIVRRS